MRVVHLVPAAFGADGIVGGAERYAMELARHMASRMPTSLVTFGDRDQRKQIDALEIRVLGGPWHVRGQRSNPFHFELFSVLQDADVVHCHQQHVLMSSAAAAWCRLRGKRVFVSELGGGGWDISAYISTDAWFHGHLHLSEYSRRIYQHETLASARVIGGGVDADRFSPDGAMARDETVLFVGRVLPHKGIDDLIRGLPAGMSLTVAGPHPDREYTAALATLAAHKDVRFKEGLDDNQLVLEYRRALCVVLPSVYRTASGLETAVPELLGQALLEGMACEAPTVCTNVASLPEIVENGATGWVVPPNAPDAIGARLQMLHDSPERACAMGKAGRRRVLQSFTWDAVVTRCIDAYSEGWQRLRPDSPVPLRSDGSTPG